MYLKADTSHLVLQNADSVLGTVFLYIETDWL